MMISANIGIESTSNSLEFAKKKSGKVWSHDKRSSYFYDPSMMFYNALVLRLIVLRLTLGKARTYSKYPMNW